MAAFELPPFKEGTAVEVRYLAPSGGRTPLDLMKDDHNYMINVSTDVANKRVTLNTKESNVWGEKVTIDDVELGSPGDPITVKVEAKSDHFLVIVNGQFVNKFQYRYSISDIKKAKIFPSDTEMKFYIIYP